MSSHTLYTVEAIRNIEKKAQLNVPPGTLMQMAGQSAFEWATQLAVAHRPILVLVGPGNNGGDALVAAHYLKEAHYIIHILHYPPHRTASMERQAAYSRILSMHDITWLDNHSALQDNYGLVIDGLFGIGLSSHTLPSTLAGHITQINAMTCPVLALDIPSGLDADTGQLLVTPTIRASHTLTFLGNKPGLHTAYGKDYAGYVRVAPLVDKDYLFTSLCQLNHPDLFPSIYSKRQHNSHKGTYGTTMIIGGARGMQGAIILAGRAALLSGAGRVVLGFIENAPHIDPVQPELMCHPSEILDIKEASALLVGPGLGNTPKSTIALERILTTLTSIKDKASHPYLVLDADALNMLAAHAYLKDICKHRPPFHTLFTPHPLEAARLLGCDVSSIQKNRLQAAKQIAQDYQVVVILKGSGSVLAQPNGQIVVNPTGNPGLATGGTGDVLAGVCAALVAQHGSIWEAALAGTYLHGQAADSLVAQHIGPVGLMPSELLYVIRRLLNTLEKLT